MSDETDKEQRDAEKQAGQKIKDAKDSLDGLGKPDLQPGERHPLPPGFPNLNIPEDSWENQRQLDDAFKTLTRNIKKKLNRLKQLINDHKYDDADNLVDDIRDELDKGVQTSAWKYKFKSGKNDKATKIRDALKQLEDIKDTNLWHAMAFSPFKELVASLIVPLVESGPVLEVIDAAVEAKSAERQAMLTGEPAKPKRRR